MKWLYIRLVPCAYVAEGNGCLRFGISDRRRPGSLLTSGRRCHRTVMTLRNSRSTRGTHSNPREERSTEPRGKRYRTVHTRRRSTPVTVAVAGAAFTVAVVVAGWGGHSTVAVVVGLIGVLLTSYFVRHRMRARLIYGRRPHTSDTGPDAPQPDDAAVSVPPQSRAAPRSG
jgi:hypothetical protein